MSWFGKFENGAGAETDLFNLYPADGSVNSSRGDLPLGYVQGGVILTSSNGSKIGTCKGNRKAGRCFEVTDDLKGDLARSYFFLSMAYRGKWKYGDEQVGVNKEYIKPWMEKDLRAWHKSDPVDQLERGRNDEI